MHRTMATLRAVAWPLLLIATITMSAFPAAMASTPSGMPPTPPDAPYPQDVSPGAPEPLPEGVMPPQHLIGPGEEDVNVVPEGISPPGKIDGASPTPPGMSAPSKLDDAPELPPGIPSPGN